MPIQFFSEEIPFKLNTPTKYSAWLIQLIEHHRKDLQDLNYIFCSDDYLLEINRTHLDHDFYTDIITFDNSDKEDTIEADIFISVERVKENAINNQVDFEHELSRVMVHGLLHLFGYQDKTAEEKRVMREKEDACISLQEK